MKFTDLGRCQITSPCFGVLPIFRKNCTILSCIIFLRYRVSKTRIVKKAANSTVEFEIVLCILLKSEMDRHSID